MAVDQVNPEPPVTSPPDTSPSDTNLADTSQTVIPETSDPIVDLRESLLRTEGAGKGGAASDKITSAVPIRTRPHNPIQRVEKPRPHVCETCERAFARLEHLKRHERSHTKEKPFQCDECARRFARRDLLLRHQQKLHNTCPQPRPRGNRDGGSRAASSRARKGSLVTANGSKSLTTDGNQNIVAETTSNTSSTPPSGAMRSGFSNPVVEANLATGPTVPQNLSRPLCNNANLSSGGDGFLTSVGPSNLAAAGFAAGPPELQNFNSLPLPRRMSDMSAISLGGTNGFNSLNALPGMNGSHEVNAARPEYMLDMDLDVLLGTTTKPNRSADCNEPNSSSSSMRPRAHTIAHADASVLRELNAFTALTSNAASMGRPQGSQHNRHASLASFSTLLGGVDHFPPSGMPSIISQRGLSPGLSRIETQFDNPFSPTLTSGFDSTPFTGHTINPSALHYDPSQPMSSVYGLSDMPSAQSQIDSDLNLMSNNYFNDSFANFAFPSENELRTDGDEASAGLW